MPSPNDIPERPNFLTHHTINLTVETPLRSSFSPVTTNNTERDVGLIPAMALYLLILPIPGVFFRNRNILETIPHKVMWEFNTFLTKGLAANG